MLLRGINPMQPDPREEQNRRARQGIESAQSQLEQLQGPQDYSKLQQYARDRSQQGRGHLLMALAAQEAGEQFRPMSGMFLKQALASREPIKTDTGFVTETGEHIEDPSAQAQQKIKVAQAQLQKYEQILQQNVTAEERERARSEQQQWQQTYQQSMLELRQQQMAMTGAIAQGNQLMRQQQQAAAQQVEAEKLAAAQQKRAEAAAAASTRMDRVEGQAMLLAETVKDAKKLVSGLTAGLGSSLAAIPSTDARNLSARLDTLKANLGFDRLDQMRAESKTGGALGQVAVQELNMLQAVVTSLDQAQSPQQLMESLERIDKHYKNWLRLQRENYSASAPSGPPAGAVRQGGGGSTFEGASVEQPSEVPAGAVRLKGSR